MTHVKQLINKNLLQIRLPFLYQKEQNLQEQNLQSKIVLKTVQTFFAHHWSLCYNPVNKAKSILEEVEHFFKEIYDT